MKSRQKSRHYKKSILYVVIALVAIATVSFVYFHSRSPKTQTIPSTLPTNAKSKIDNTGNSSKATAQSDQNNTNSGSTPSSQTTQKSSNSQGTADNLLAPFGSFVSNHSPSLSNSDLVMESSVCNTSPGASCYIQFTKGDLTRSLESQIANNDGSVYWQWNIKDANLSAGSWQIKAVATANGKSLSTTDTNNLSVQP